MYGCSLDYHHPSSSSSSSSSCIFLVCIIGWVLRIAGVGWLVEEVCLDGYHQFAFSGNKSLFVRLWRGRERESLVCVSFLSSL